MFSESGLYKEDINYIAAYDINWDKIRNSTILITGATGLIGTVLVDSLMCRNKLHSTNVRVVIMSRSLENAQNHFKSYIDDDLFAIAECDITKSFFVNEKVDYIVHLASNTHPALYANRPIETIDTIVLGTKNILEFAAEHNVKRVVNTSSVEVYGENRGDINRFTEEYNGYINCNTLRAGYPEGKRLAESMCQAYINEKGIDVVSVRLGRIYGAPVRKTDTKSTTQFINNAVNNEDIILKSKGLQKFSYTYVADTVTAYLQLLANGQSGEAYNVAHDEIKTFVEVANILANINGKQVKFEYPDSTIQKGGSSVQSALLDSKKIRQLGWKAKYDLKSGLVRTVAILRSKND